MLTIARASAVRRLPLAVVGVRAYAYGEVIPDMDNVFHEPEGVAKMFTAIATERFPDQVVNELLAPIPDADIEVKPDGLLYLPEIKYRRILNKAFGPGAWAMVPMGVHLLQASQLSREYALFAMGRYVAQARGEMQVFSRDGLVTASEGAKSNALMRCCKDLGIASVLWDPAFILRWKAEFAVSRPAPSGRGKVWSRRDRPSESELAAASAKPSATLAATAKPVTAASSVAAKPATPAPAVVVK